MFSNNGTPKQVVKSTEIPRLFITLEANTALDTVINRVDKFSGKEIGWLGEVERVNERDFILSRIFIPKQEVHATTTEITPTGLEELANDLLDRDMTDVINKLKLWGHSHVNMGVTPSGQDNSQLAEFSKNNEDFFIRMIMNKKGSYKVDLLDMVRDTTYENIEMITLYPDFPELRKELEADILANVSEKSYSYGSTGGYWDSKNRVWVTGKERKEAEKNKTVTKIHKPTNQGSESLYIEEQIEMSNPYNTSNVQCLIKNAEDYKVFADGEYEYLKLDPNFEEDIFLANGDIKTITDVLGMYGTDPVITYGVVANIEGEPINNILKEIVKLIESGLIPKYIFSEQMINKYNSIKTKKDKEDWVSKLFAYKSTPATRKMVMEALEEGGK